MTTCGNCRHWRKIRDEDYLDWPGPHGECHLIDEHSTDKKAWTYLSLGPLDPAQPILNAGGETCLITIPDFGCVHGET